MNFLNYLYFTGEYEQNQCAPGDVTCPKCPDRLPTCVGLPDGDNLFIGREWKPDYAVCYKNRTIELKKCTKGYFHPTKRACTEIIDHGWYFKSFIVISNCFHCHFTAFQVQQKQA